MSGGLEVLQLKEEDVVKFLTAGVHLGANNVNFQMEDYVYKRKMDGMETCFFVQFSLSTTQCGTIQLG